MSDFKRFVDEAGKAGGVRRSVLRPGSVKEIHLDARARSVQWDAIEDKPSTFLPSAHNHPATEITGLGVKHHRIDIQDFWQSPFWGQIPDKPATFPPSAHNHVRSEVTDLWDSPFWTNIPDKPATFPPSSHGHVKADITDIPWAWSDISKTGSNLTDIATRAHISLTGIGANDHHNQSHALIGGDHSVSGLTPGHFLKATGANSYAFAAHGLNYSDVGAQAPLLTHSPLYLSGADIGLTGLNSLGAANQFMRMKNDSSGLEWISFAGTSNRITISHAAGTITFNAPQDIHTGAGPSFDHLHLNVATGTAPLEVASTTKVNNLNVDRVDGYDLDQSVKTSDGPSFDHVHLTVAEGTAPLAVTSKTKVTNLNADLFEGGHLVYGSGRTATESGGTATLTTTTPKFSTVIASGLSKMWPVSHWTYSIRAWFFDHDGVNIRVNLNVSESTAQQFDLEWWQIGY